ncbi:acyl-CoA thioesterase II [Aeromicrobium sp. SMF47]|uniref:acyl-CoA thioesterase n=1 Tax=Aeromicrobium TaxID=2040 RepID=UPI00129DEC8B|nr:MULTISPECIES: acyl-CoA thioesterase domain-containing protein [Aeromicrobium]MRJ77346.1 acyl-CoA thioesterase II [Aeromicrobium yanjiei]MRK01714.1 acyl-CoA thioesterase II [Aeromicrobium sp. S22]
MTTQVSRPTTPGRPRLANVLVLTPVGPDAFEGDPGAANSSGGVYGGLVFAQAAAAASLSVDDDRVMCSVQGQFLRSGSFGAPITYAVGRARDGRSFSNRSVEATQFGQVIFTLTASFHVPEDGFDHQIQVFDAPGPEGLPSMSEALTDVGDSTRDWMQAMLGRVPFEIRPADELPQVAWTRGETPPPRQRFWLRPYERLSADPYLNMISMLYASDLFLLSSTLPPHHVVLPELQFGSLDHSVWLHRSVEFDDWLLFEQEGFWAGGGLGLCRGVFFNRRGQVVANTAQQGLIRPPS